MAIIGNIHKLAKQLEAKKLDIVFDYLQQALDEDSEVHRRIFSLPAGSFEKVPLRDGIFALEQVFYTKERHSCFIESHEHYIDFQLILEGTEAMEYIDIDKLEVDTPYDDAKDLVTYKMVDYTSRFILQQGDLAIFFPDDAHVGLPMYETPTLVYKSVIKLPIEQYG